MQVIQSPFQAVFGLFLQKFGRFFLQMQQFWSLVLQSHVGDCFKYEVIEFFSRQRPELLHAYCKALRGGQVGS